MPSPPYRPRRSALGPVVSLTPNMDAQRAAFDKRFQMRDDGFLFYHKGYFYLLNQADHARAVAEFDALLEQVRARFARFIALAFLGAVSGAFLYFGFVDSLIALLPQRLQTVVNAILLFQPILWACGLAWWQERQIGRIHDGIAARLSRRQGAMWRDADAAPGRDWGSILLQAAALAALASVFGGALLGQMFPG